MSNEIALGSADEKVFENALIVVKRRGDLQDTASLQIALTTIERAVFLTSATRRERVLRLLRFLQVRPEVAVGTAMALEGIAPAAVSALRAYLPERFRAMTFREDADRVIEFPEQEAEAITRNPVLSNDTDLDVFVVLIGTINEFGTSNALLLNHGFLVERVDSIDLVSPDVLARTCGIVVGKSRYENLTPEEQTKLLSSIARTTSQAWLKFGTDGLHVTLKREIENLRTNLGFTRDRMVLVHITDRSELSESEIGFLRSSAERILSCTSAVLLVDGLDPMQTLLVCIAVRHQLELLGLTQFISNSINVTVFRGKSGALILMCRVTDCQHLFALRLGKRDQLLEGEFAELPRIKDLIQPWRDVMPSVYHSGANAVLVYRTVQSSSQPVKPAATLAERLDSLQSLEPPDSQLSIADARECVIAVREAFELLESLNRTKIEGPKMSNEYLNIHFAQMAHSGKCFAGPGYLDNSWFKSVLLKAVEIVDKCQECAVCHADPHVRNILLPSAGHAELIDFERACISHPLYDISHLAISITAHAYRDYASLEDIVDEFYSVLFGSDSSTMEFSEALSVVNVTVLHALSEYRKAGNRLSAFYQLQEEEFAAMLIVVTAIVMMYLPQLHGNIAKAAFIAAGRRLHELLPGQLQTPLRL